MSDNTTLRDQLRESIKELEKERVEVLKQDEKVFGASPELEEMRQEKIESSETTHKEDVSDVSLETPQNDPILEDISEPEALAHWPDEKKKTFQDLNKEAKQFILERERDFNSDYTKKTQKLAEERKIAEKYKNSIGAHEEYLKSRGMDPYKAAQDAIAFERTLAEASPKDRAKIIKQLADMYKADFTDDDDAPQDYDPKISKIEREIQELRSANAKYENERQAAQGYQLQREIQTFKNSKDDKGKLKYPHFDQLMVKMGTLIVAADEAGDPITMEDAYESALLSNKELRTEFINNYHNTKAREEDNKKRLLASKAASFNVKSTGGESNPAPRLLSIRDALKKAMEDANAYS